MRTISDIGFFQRDGEAAPPQSATLTVEEYAQSMHVGSYKKIPLSGAQVVQKIIETVKRLIPSMETVPGTVYVYRDQFTTPGLLKSEITPDIPISKMAFNRIIATIGLIEGEEYSAQIAVKYETDNYVEVAFGTEVRTCSNFNIFGQENVLKTSRNEDVSLEDILEYVEKHVTGVAHRMQMDMDVINQLSKISVGEDRNSLIGKLFISARSKQPTMQQTDLGVAVDSMLEKLPVTAWDFLNDLTAAIKFGTSSGAQTIQHLNGVCNFMCEEYGIEPGKYPIDDEVPPIEVE